MRASSPFMVRSFPAFLGIAVVLAACSSSEPRPAPAAERIDATASPIINGQVDTTHQAVILLASQSAAGDTGGLCSGTIVKVDTATHIGWIATAAHCVTLPPVFVLQGDDYSQAGSLRYDIVDYAADPQYNGQTGSPHDFAVVRIAGVDATTPIIPLVGSPDGLAVGTNVVSVGYGRTSLIATGTGPGTENTVRRHVAKQLSAVGQLIEYNMATDGICSGDSGGPVLITGSGGERVAGIHSYVEGDCNGNGFSVRVTFDAAFLSDQLAKPAPTDDCTLCGKVANSGNSLCAEASKKCINDKECGGYYQCLQDGKTAATCLAQFPKAEGPFNVAANCTCTQACSKECTGTAECKSAPKCGYHFPAGDCTVCTESACCDEALACASDGTCYVCLKTKDAAAECATNAARKTMATCVANKCKTQCAGSGLDTGATPPADPDAGDDPNAPAAAAPTSSTTTTSGCSVTLATSRTTGAAPLLAGLGLLLVSLRRRRRA